MRTRKLPAAVASYLTAANEQDIEAVAACFDQDAVVRDEGMSRRGIAAVRQWAREVSEKYRPAVEVIDVTDTDSGTIVTARVAGAFPGSPVDLRYAFTLHQGKIVRLEIS